MASFASFAALLAQASATAEAPDLPLDQQLWFRTLIAAAIIGGAFGLGAWLSKVWRMPDYSFRFGVILFALIAGAVICLWSWPPKLGIDLKGGVILIYEVDETQQTAPMASDFDMDDLVAALNRRINPGGQKEVVVRKFGERQVEIIIPEVAPAEIDQLKNKITTAGLLEFRILANDRDDARAIELAGANPLAKEVADPLDLDDDENPRVIAKWVTLDKDKMKAYEGMHTRTGESGEVEVLVRADPYNVSGGYLARATSGIDEIGAPAVHFSFRSDGAILFGELTSHNLPDQATGFYRHLGIILDGRLFSAPRLESAISSQGRITGNFEQEEVDFIVEILNAGRLPAALAKTPVSQTQISPQLGDDTIRNGRITMTISIAAILVFMFVYYRFSGLVADLAVLMNLLLVVALMITLGAAFTLAGLAGLVLSVGMAVDANVLIYERMREELQRGAALRMAIRNGFGRAMSTIIDSNLTTLLTGVVLYAIGTDQLKGFAITLILGLMLNLFTAVYVARVIFDVAERRRWLTQLKMMKMFDAPGFDFVKPTKYAIGFSLIVIGIGLAAGAARGTGLFGIDFTGGSSVQIVLKENEKLTVGQVREIVEPRDETGERLEDVTVSSVGLPNAGGTNRYYKIDTSMEDIAEVERQLKTLFENKLQVYQMAYTAPRLIESATMQEVFPAKSGEKAKGISGAAEKTAPDDAQKETKSAKDVSDDAKQVIKETTPDVPPDKTGNANGSGNAASPDATKGSDTTKEGAKKVDAANEKSQSSARLPRGLLNVTAIPALVLLQDEGNEDKPADDAKKAASDAADATKNNAAAAKEGTVKDEAKVNDEAKAKADSKVKDDTKAGPVTDDSAERAKSKIAEPSTKTPFTTPFSERPAAKGETAPAAIFVGGSETRLNFPEGINRETLQAKLEATAAELQLRPAQFLLEDPERSASSRTFNEWTVRTSLPPDQAVRAMEAVRIDFAETPVFRAASNIGGKVADHAQVMAIYAMLASMVMIVVYVWVRFQNIVFGLAAVVALVHDVLVTIAALAVSYYVADFLGWAMVDPFKISLDVVAALLTIVGFSINDTIVIFDRIREIKGKSPEVTADMVNRAVNQTLGRTILTSGTVLIVTIILYVWGGQEIHPFAFAMLVGLISGTYSTVYIASPLVLWLRKPGTQRKVVTSRGTEVAMRA